VATVRPPGEAVIAAGAARTAADIDITTEEVPVERLRAALKKAGSNLRKDIESATAKRGRSMVD
jgi:hypothetical protein